jgi:hypothetical protein
MSFCFAGKNAMKTKEEEEKEEGWVCAPPPVPACFAICFTICLFISPDLDGMFLFLSGL